MKKLEYSYVVPVTINRTHSQHRKMQVDAFSKCHQGIVKMLKALHAVHVIHLSRRAAQTLLLFLQCI